MSGGFSICKTSVKIIFAFCKYVPKIAFGLHEICAKLIFGLRKICKNISTWQRAFKMPCRNGFLEVLYRNEL